MEQSTSPARFPNSDRADMNDLIDHLTAQLDADEKAAEATGQDRIAWLTYLDDDGHMHYTTVAAEAMTDVWIANGDELPAPARTLVVYDPARALREVAALRQVINDYRMADRACMGADAGDPSYATIRAGRDAFKSVLQTYAEASGWRPSR